MTQQPEPQRAQDVPFGTDIVLRPTDAELRVSGRVGAHGRKRFEACFASVCNAARPRVVVDVTEVTSWEPDAFTMIADAVRSCQRSGSDVTFVGAPTALSEALDAR